MILRPTPRAPRRFPALRRRGIQTSPGLVPGPRASRLHGELKTIEQALREAEAQPARVEPIELDRVGEALRGIDPLWDVLFPAEQERIVRLLVEDIIVTTSGIDIRFHPVVYRRLPPKPRLRADPRNHTNCSFLPLT